MKKFNEKEMKKSEKCNEKEMKKAVKKKNKMKNKPNYLNKYVRFPSILGYFMQLNTI